MLCWIFAEKTPEIECSEPELAEQLTYLEKLPDPGLVKSLRFCCISFGLNNGSLVAITDKLLQFLRNYIELVLLIRVLLYRVFGLTKISTILINSNLHNNIFVACLLLSSIFFIFMQFSGKIWQNIRLEPHSGESWI